MKIIHNFIINTIFRYSPLAGVPMISGSTTGSLYSTSNAISGYSQLTTSPTDLFAANAALLQIAAATGFL